jgi:hypothetical protein
VNHDVKIANKPSENVEKLNYLEKSVTNQNCIEEEIKRRLNSGSGWCHSVPPFFYRPCMNVKIKI